MKVICINKGVVNPLSEIKDHVAEGVAYTVRCEETGYSTYAERYVDTYGFEEVEGLYEKGMFMPLSEFDERLMVLLRTRPNRWPEKKSRFKSVKFEPVQFTYFPDVMEERAYKKKDEK
jgi:hypothetical protein